MGWMLRYGWVFLIKGFPWLSEGRGLGILYIQFQLRILCTKARPPSRLAAFDHTILGVCVCVCVCLCVRVWVCVCVHVLVCMRQSAELRDQSLTHPPFRGVLIRELPQIWVWMAVQRHLCRQWSAEEKVIRLMFGCACLLTLPLYHGHVTFFC